YQLSYVGRIKSPNTVFMEQNQANFISKALIDIISTRRFGIDCTGLSGSMGAYLVSHLYRTLGVPLIVITSTPKDAEMFIEDLRFFEGTSEAQILYFPSYNILPFKFLSYHNETAAKRIRTLYRLIESDPAPMVVTTVSALMQKIVPKRRI
ncbi:hypothetical protein C6A37_09995, partial [Desulfobacteraceae bacterium SEEP-SAG9]